MPKMKTKKSLLRRVKVTSKGKILHGSSFKRHLRRNKGAAQKRRYRKTSEFSRAMSKKIIQRLGVKCA